MDLLETEETVTAGLIGYQKMTNEFIGQSIGSNSTLWSIGDEKGPASQFWFY